MDPNHLEIDFAQLRMLSDDDEEFMIDILEIIELESPTVVDQLKSQLSQTDYGPFAATAHKYKSTINVLGNIRLNQLVKDLEDSAKQEDRWEELKRLVGEFEVVCDQLLVSVRDELERLQG